MSPANLSTLPWEILLHIMSFLEPVHIAQLQLVSKDLFNVARDDMFWRSKCFEDSSYLDFIHRRRRIIAAIPQISRQPADSPGGTLQDLMSHVKRGSSPRSNAHAIPKLREREKVRIMANWDFSYPSERVSWYDEYIQRQAPISVNWFQQSHNSSNQSYPVDPIEARGVALYRPDGPGDGFDDRSVLAVSPLDDGGIGIWDVKGTRGRQGAIVARSRPGILFVDQPGSANTWRSRRVDSGVTECVSVDSVQHRAFFAVQSRIIDIDLRTLSVVGYESFPWSITTLSEASTVPLTIGTNLGIHFHDYRSRTSQRSDGPEMVDSPAHGGATYLYEPSLRSLFRGEPLPPYAALHQPGPLSILHLPKPGSEVEVSDDIYVAGRFSSILHYDRRKFPALVDSIHSGARLCCMTSLPYSFSRGDLELRRKGELSLEQAQDFKSRPGGRTLIAGGEYNSKGSLELYSLPDPGATASGPRGAASVEFGFQNRQTSSTSKLLSVANHGTRIVVSDGSGYVKWFERDGFTGVRVCRIGNSEKQASSLYSSMPASDDMARKLLPIRTARDDSGSKSNKARVSDSDLLFWTGEKLGLLSFSSRPAFSAEDFEDKMLSDEDHETARAEQLHRETMQRALRMHAQDVQFVRNLGLGSGQVG
ncbi:hypothetical protein VTK73DRAFT_2194 [Phialemonium thermophilum]|uniref:F-box domain-containing protein n=1 Tax=Phialemonium thermophilum TaxID=223376 RepID=A0ABR3Y2M3_9PEZI